MDRFLNFFERKFGSWAIPGLIRYLAIIFFATSLLGFMKPELVSTLDFDYVKIMEGEYWRILSFILAPDAYLLRPEFIIFAFFGMIITFIFGDTLEYQWGVFRTNLFVLWGYLSALLANYLMATVFEYPFPFSGIYLGTSILFAFATYNPHFTLRLFFVLPCPVWLIALVTGLFILRSCLFSLPLTVATALCLSNYLVFALPMALKSVAARQSSRMRSSKFKSMSHKRERTPFHSCSACGANDISHPEKEFRVAQDGNDYCMDHLPE